MTTSTPRSPHGRFDGSRSASTLTSRPPMRRPPSVTVTSSASLPSTVSYLSRCAIVFLSPRSLTATISSSPGWLSATARQKFRPIRPNPLTPTRVATLLTPRYRPRRLAAEVTRRRSRRVGEHLGRQVGLGVGDPQVLRTLVGHGEQTADPAGDGVLGERWVGQRAELL